MRKKPNTNYGKAQWRFAVEKPGKGLKTTLRYRLPKTQNVETSMGGKSRKT